VRKADNLPPSCGVVTKYGNLSFLEPSGLVQASNGTALALPLLIAWTLIKGKKVRCTFVEALKLCTDRTAHRGKRGIALLFPDQEGEGSASGPGRSLPRETPGTHFTGGWVVLRAGLDRCGKSHPNRDSIPGPSSP